MKGLYGLLLLALLAGCAKPALRCDAHLTPINVPASLSKGPGGRTP